MILDFLFNNIVLNIDVLGSITLLVVMRVLYCWHIIAVYLQWFFNALTTLSLGINFLNHIACPTNYVYIVEDVVTAFLEFFHNIAPFVSVCIYIYPDVDFSVSKQPVKSESG
jgi:hypothetical protein